MPGSRKEDSVGGEAGRVPTAVLGCRWSCCEPVRSPRESQVPLRVGQGRDYLRKLLLVVVPLS